MPQFLKNLAFLTLLVLSGQPCWGFALLGPINEPYQVPTIGYNVFGDIGAPKNLGEAYRRNTPVLYYSVDANFLDYFSSNGVFAVDSAVAILNGITNVSQLSGDLSEFPSQAERENYLAEALSLIDVKTWALKMLVEQLGLAQPERFVWGLHDRVQIPGFPTPCPAGMVYSIIQRNFNPGTSAFNQFQSSSYVNGTLYTYFIDETCPSTVQPICIAVPVSVDPLDFSYTAVAGQPVLTTVSLLGRFYTGLTRDDVGGLRYLYRTNLMAYESTGPNTFAAVTNPVPQILFTSNLTLFASQALTNDPVTLQTLYPNLSIVNSSNYFVNVLVTNVTPYFTNPPWAPAGSTLLAFATNVVPTIQIRYVDTFGNLLLLSGTSNNLTLVPLTQIPPANGKAIITIETDTVGTAASPFGPAGSIIVTTNSTFRTFVTNAVVGDIVILPTNLCSAQILGTQLTFVTTATNFLGSATNSLTITNASGLTNAGTTLFISQSEITYFTNHAFLILPVTCVASNVALFQGIDRVSFVRRDYDSLLGRFFAPLTNSYTLNSITNNTLVPQPILRTIVAPDILFSARDSATGPESYPPLAPIVERGINFNTNFENVALAGPGTIEPFTTVTFDKVGPIYFNTYQTAFSVDTAQAGQVPIRILGSFDGTTNAPIVYPNGTSIANLENQILIGISPALLPQGQVGVDYGTGSPTFTATGANPPVAWSLAANSPGLPPGLYLMSDGTLGGTPTVDGTFDFTIMLTDAGGRTVDRAYFITIIP